MSSTKKANTATGAPAKPTTSSVPTSKPAQPALTRAEMHVQMVKSSAAPLPSAGSFIQQVNGFGTPMNSGVSSFAGV